ncbi:MAG: hypothetical protein ABIF19_17855 [Planctomycetota bacterium]
MSEYEDEPVDIVIIIKSLGVLFVLIGVAYLLRPDIIKGLMGFFKKGRRIYFAGVLRFALAVVFLTAATECRMPRVIGALGIIFLLSGVLIFLLGPERIRRILEWYEEQPTLIFRIIASVVAAVGMVIIFSA